MGFIEHNCLHFNASKDVFLDKPRIFQLQRHWRSLAGCCVAVLGEKVFLPAALLPIRCRGGCNRRFARGLTAPLSIPLPQDGCSEASLPPLHGHTLPPGGLRCPLLPRRFGWFFICFGKIPFSFPRGCGAGAFLTRRKDSVDLLQEMRFTPGVSREVAGHLLVIKIINQFSFQRWHQGKCLPFLCCWDSEAYRLWQLEPAINNLKIILSPK